MEFKQLIFTLDEGLYIINILRITTFSETGKKINLTCQRIDFFVMLLGLLFRPIILHLSVIT